MATLNINQIEDFSELGQDFVFKCNEEIYCIPPIPPFTAKKLLNIGRDFSKKNEKRDAIIKEIEEKNKDLPIDQQIPMPSEVLEDAGSFFDFQIDFIILTNPIRINEKGEKISDVTKEEIEGNKEKDIKGWSTQLVLKVFRRVNEIISVEQEKKS